MLIHKVIHDGGWSRPLAARSFRSRAGLGGARASVAPGPRRRLRGPDIPRTLTSDPENHPLESRLEAGAAPVLLLSGGKGGAKGGGRPSEAEVMRDLALAAGVAAGVAAGAAEKRLVLETESRSTLENARCSARIMRARGWAKALVVTDAVHLPRALIAFRALGIEATGAAVMGGARDAPVWTWPVHLAREALAFLWYAALIAAGRHRR